MSILQNLLPRYTILDRKDNRYTIFTQSKSITMHISRIKNSKMIILLHNNFIDIKQFLELNNFIFDGVIYENINLK